MQVHLICGPPGSGKNTYVREHMRWGDLVIDTDAIFEALTFLPFYEKPQAMLPLVFATRNFLLSYVRQYGFDGYNVWVIMGGAKRAERDDLKFAFDAEVVVLEKTLNECLKNIINDKRRYGLKKMEQWRPLIEKWWEKYER